MNHFFCRHNSVSVGVMICKCKRLCALETKKNIICHRRRCRYQTDINVTLGLTVNGECSVNYKYMRHGEAPVSSDHDRDQRASPASPALPFSGVFWRRELHRSASSSSGNNNTGPFDRGPDNIVRWVISCALRKCLLIIIILFPTPHSQPISHYTLPIVSAALWDSLMWPDSFYESRALSHPNMK